MEFAFHAPGLLIDEELQLLLARAEIDTSGREPLPTYRFKMVKTDSLAEVGFINLRIGGDANLVNYRGHIGYGVEPEHRGHHYAARACRLLLPLARRHGLDPLWITCNPDNSASRRTCELLGAALVEEVTVPEGTEAYEAGARRKCRYRLDLSTK